MQPLARFRVRHPCGGRIHSDPRRPSVGADADDGRGRRRPDGGGGSRHSDPPFFRPQSQFRLHMKRGPPAKGFHTFHTFYNVHVITTHGGGVLYSILSSLRPRSLHAACHPACEGRAERRACLLACACYTGLGPATPTANVTDGSGLTHGTHAGALGSSSTLGIGTQPLLTPRRSLRTGCITVLN